MRSKEAEAVLMPVRRAEEEAGTSSVWTYRGVAACLILAAAAAHLVYLASPVALDLASDEAHYWDWARHPDWSYYSKGPLIAWLIAIGCRVAGSWSQLHTGSLAFAVRWPAVLCSSLLVTSLYILTVQVFRREKLALAVVALSLTLPLIAVGSSLMTIDAPYTCLWGWALVVGHQALFRRSWWAWPVLGVILGLGILAKYTMVLWIPFVGLFLLTTPEHRPQFFRPGFWVMCVIAGLSCVPLLIWNWQHEWMTFQHVQGLAGMADPQPRNRFSWIGMLAYVGGQAGLLLIFWFVAWSAALVAYRPGKEQDAGIRYLWWMSAPMFGVFLGFSVKTGGGEVNWPVTAYLAGMVLAAAWLERQLQSPRAWYRRLTTVNLGFTCAVGLGLTLTMHHSVWLYPLLTRLVRNSQDPFPLRRLDPTCRLRGWHELAAAVDRVRSQVRAELGEDPVLAGCSWTMPGQLGVYCAGHPQVFTLGPALGERYNQYDLWRPNPVDDSQKFCGKTFVVVNLATELVSAFDRIDPPTVVTYSEQGQPLSGWSIQVCHGFHGDLKPAPYREH